MFRFTKALIALSLGLGVLSLTPVFDAQDASAQGFRPAQPTGKNNNTTPPTNNKTNNNTPPANTKNNTNPPTNNTQTNLNNIFQKNSGVQTFSPKGYLGGGTLPPVIIPTQPQYNTPFFNPNMYQQNPYQNQNQNFRPYNNFNNFNNFNSNLNPFGLPFGANQFQNFNNFQNANNFNPFANPFNNNIWNNDQMFFPNNLPQQNFNFGVPGPQFNFNFQVPNLGQQLPQRPGNFNPFGF